MAKYDANWWFGTNSVWQQSGLKTGLTGEGEREGGISGFFSSVGDAVGDVFNKPIKLEHGPDNTMKYIIGGLILYAFIKK